MENVTCPHVYDAHGDCTLCGSPISIVEIAERRNLHVTQARQDLEALKRAQGLAHAYWLKADTAPKRLWSITGRQLQEAITDTERYLQKLEEGS